jgi:hypothetical protein
MKALIYLVLILELTIAYSEDILPAFFQWVGSPRSITGLILLYLFILMLLIHPMYLKKLKIPEIKLIVLLMSIYLLFLTARNIVYIPIYLSYFFNLYKRYIFILALICMVILAIDSKQKFRSLMTVATVILSFSSCIGLLQYFNFQFAWDIRIIFGYSDEEIEKQVLAEGRIMGLSEYAISFSYLLATLIPLNFSLIKTERNHLTRLILTGCSMLMMMALLLNMTRSAVIGVLVAFIYLMATTSTIPKGVVLAVIGIGFLFLITKQDELLTYTFYNRYTMSDKSAIIRIPVMIVGFIIFFQNPFGISISDYLNYLDFVSGYIGWIDGLTGSEFLTDIYPHNQVLTAGVQVGWIVLLLLWGLYWGVGRRMFYLTKHAGDPDIQWLAHGMIGSLIAYLITSMFHNAGPFTGHVFHWFFIALAFSLYRIELTAQSSFRPKK